MNGKLWFKTLLAGLMLLTLVVAGCDDGDDGRDGAPGASAYEIAVENGFIGTEQEWLDSLAAAGGGVAEPVETCVICHGEGSFADAEAAHAIDREVSYTVLTPPTADGEDLVVALDIRVNGAPYDLLTDVQRTVIFQGVNGVYTRNQFTNNSNEFLESVANGVYTFRIPSGTLLDGVPVTPSDFVGTDARVYFRLNTPEGVTPARRASVSADDAAYARLDLASDQACINCHGNFAGGLTSHHYNPFEVSNCIACHSAVNPPADLSLLYLAHGIHNAHNMPSGGFVAVEGEEAFQTTYPTYMTNCSVCHDSDAALAVANAMPVSGTNCLSCHGDMTSWDFVAAGVGFHTAYNGTEDCQACHVPDGTGIARASVAAFHNGLTTERAGLIWDGMDASVNQGDRIDHQITGVTRTGDSLAITWNATVDGNAVDPCNTTATVDAPTFTSGYSVLKAFFQGGDLVNADNGNSSPGQANSTNLDFTAGTGNTVCAGNVATTTITLTPEEAVLTGDARIALQGKPQILFAAANETIAVRSKTPTFDFALADGAAAGDRRSIAVSESCLQCHVGSLYQHGGNRVDNVELCVMCHNEASSEQNVREGMGVDPSEAYDGKAGQTYGFKSMLHAIHSSGETGAPIVIYRNRGIFAWAADDSVLANWPGTGSQTVFGSDPASPNSIQTHNFHSPTYPRALNDCAACHAEDFSVLPDQSVAVATTINAGSAPFDNQLDDVLEGTSAAACMSCHQSDVGFEQNALKTHAYQNGWTPQTFEEGRQTIIDAAQ